MNSDQVSTPLLENHLIIGLGNPGREYQNNRHNIGFMVLNQVATHFTSTFTRTESKALITKVEYCGGRLILAKPQTYMNLSGTSVGSLVKFYKIPFEKLLIVYDEIDLPFGTLRLRGSGGSAGHNGMQSIIERLGCQNIARLRVGVGRPPGRRSAADFVLKDFSSDEKAELPIILARATAAVLSLVKVGLIETMNLYNTGNSSLD